ncbi:MAG: glycoside hydrolase family 19 protein [Lysobacter sp.]
MTNEAIKKWVYPFLDTEGNEISDDDLLTCLGRGDDGGFYPLGSNGLWHGGVHFGAGTASSLRQNSGVRCIADGEVVAYRVDSAYPEVRYQSGPGARALFSTGFVLVRHRLALPNAESSAATDDRTRESQAPQILTFFSLYMHMLDWISYQSDSTRTRPMYWCLTNGTYMVGNRADDREAFAPEEIGLRIRDENHTPVAILPRGSHVRLGDAHPGRPGYFELAEVLNGTPSPASVISGYIYRDELDALPEPDASGIDGVFVLPEPMKVTAGTVLGHLGEFQRQRDGTPLPPAPRRSLLHLEVFSGDDVPAFMAASRAWASQLGEQHKTLLKIPPGARLSQPAEPDRVLPAGATLIATVDSPPNGAWAKARVSHLQIVDRSVLGNYDSTTRTYSNGAVFTGRYFDASGTRASTDAGDNTKREVLMPSGEPVWVERRALNGRGVASTDSGWSQFPLNANDASGPEAAYARVINRRALERLAGHEKAQSPDGTRWWHVSVGTVEGDGSGWVCEVTHQSGISWHSPWGWPGFEVVDETAPPVEWLQRQLALIGGVTAEEAETFRATADRLDGGPLLQAVRNAIDINNDQRLTTNELRRAQVTPWLAQSLSQLVVRYESEWGGDMAKWDAIDEIMLEGQPDWSKEKERIQRLLFWSQVHTEEWPSQPTVYHFHPAGLVSLQLNTAFAFTLEMLEFIYPGISHSLLQEIVDELNRDIAMVKLDTSLRRCHFFAQVMQETGASFRIEENLNYRASVLIDKFAYFRSRPEEALLYGRTSEHAANPQQIANRAYANRIGNGDIDSGDGWRYRGRGVKQLTGRANYREFTRSHTRIWNEEMDFEADPGLLLQTRYAVRSGLFFWLQHTLYELADAGDDRAAVDSITRIVNRWDDSYQDRADNFERLMAAEVFE